jgi:hypothetical protein
VPRPQLGVLVGTHTPPALRRLLVAAADMCRPVACSAHEPVAAEAYLWCGASARPPAGAPYAAWVSRVGDLESPVVRGATVLLSDTAALAGLVGDAFVYVPAEVLDPQARPTPPFVRRRLRGARGLPETVVGRGDGDCWYWGEAPADADLAGTVAGCASAVVAHGPALALALAWAAPTVTDPVSAGELGAVDGVHALVVADPAERHEHALRLAVDDATAARLGWAGYLLVRSRCDVHHAAWTLLTRLGVPTRAVDGALAPLEYALDALGTPAYAQVRVRARARTAPLPAHAPPEGDSP